MEKIANQEGEQTNDFLYENMTEEQKARYERVIQMLPVLQDKLNRDSKSYNEEFETLLNIFQQQFNYILFTPNKTIKGFKELLLFFSHVSNLFPDRLSFIPEGIIKLLQENYLIIPHEIDHCNGVVI